MDPSSITLLAFSSSLVIGTCAVIIAVNYRRGCCNKQKVSNPVDWVVVNSASVKQ